jgi:hypothetical protein
MASSALFASAVWAVRRPKKRQQSAGKGGKVRQIAGVSGEMTETQIVIPGERAFAREGRG